jgi:hypothetical protein
MEVPVRIHQNLALTPQSEPAIWDYLYPQDIALSQSVLERWQALRFFFPTLCGDPPPTRWALAIFNWVREQFEQDPSFTPICFRSASDLVRGISSGTPVILRYQANHCAQVEQSFQDLLLSLCTSLIEDLGGKKG